ncbi:MAG: hypothetical protein D6698_10370 [Gammaproteobacteria bacterium]|nr:MAG: hypothetical protein D6698_10370 [Gammaproteobacteria bacterium]
MIVNDRYILSKGTLLKQWRAHLAEVDEGGEGHLCSLWPLITEVLREEYGCVDTSCARYVFDPCCCKYFDSAIACDPPEEFTFCDNETIIEI